MDHPYLVVHSLSGANAAAAQRALAATASASEASAGAEEDVLNGGMCGVCHDPLEQPVVAGCGHAFCRVRISSYPYLDVQHERVLFIRRGKRNPAPAASGAYLSSECLG